jgi:hypothetical protein
MAKWFDWQRFVRRWFPVAPSVFVAVSTDDADGIPIAWAREEHAGFPFIVLPALDTTGAARLTVESNAHITSVADSMSNVFVRIEDGRWQTIDDIVGSQSHVVTVFVKE